MKPRSIVGCLIAATLGGIIASSASTPLTASAITVSPAKLPRIATVDERYQSYNVEMAEIIGAKFWKPYDMYDKQGKAVPDVGASPAASKTEGAAPQAGQNPAMFEERPPIDLTNPRLRKLASALGPAYVRVSGSWANSVFFHDSDTPAPQAAPEGFRGVLTRPQWKGVIDFAHAVNAALVTSFAISAGVRNASGVWTPDQARRILSYTSSVGGNIVAAEMFNEPSIPVFGGAPAGYDAESYAHDFAVFKPFAKAAAPDMLIVGPGSVGEGGTAPVVPGDMLLKTEDILSATPQPVFDVYSYHSYAAASQRCVSLGALSQTTAAAAMSEQWLARPDAIYSFYIGLRNRFEPTSKGVWVTETADSACGGNPWAATFLDSFRYLDRLGRLAKKGVTVSFHNTLASSEYGLLDQKTFAPRPNYWAALLWHRLMGSTVLDAGASQPGLHLYAHCMRDRPGGVTLLAINNSRTQQESLQLPVAAERYTLAARTPEDSRVQVNGRELALTADDALPLLQGAHVVAGQVTFAPASITFLAVADAGNASCLRH
ncbi:hypothetical protein [Noviherbaspirillum sp.]|uniref:hypothetical protein n=1 Tax=Noviherbaspirillum sp. TaxID=1926288 RepID=UPI002B45AE72|nr:hypothetical protein [Noviherbaspirillum sp.]HJV79895.1 hypothetical protein [Noviherbaspirillum sp.]